MLLDLGGRRGWLAAAGCLDVVRVVARQLERGGALLGDVRQRGERRSHAQQKGGDSSPEPKRLGNASRQLALELVVERGQALGGDLGSERRRIFDTVGKLLRAGQAEQLRAVD